MKRLVCFSVTSMSVGLGRLLLQYIILSMTTKGGLDIKAIKAVNKKIHTVYIFMY